MQEQENPILAKIRAAEAKEAAMTPQEREAVIYKREEEEAAIGEGRVSIFQQQNTEALRVECAKRDAEALDNLRATIAQL